MEKIKGKKFYIMCIFLFVIQMTVCIIVDVQKGRFHCDEVYSYGLSNCEEYPFINNETVKELGYNGWVDSEFFKYYVTVDTNKPISFKAAYDNQVADVHPPMYYFILHIVCYLAGGEFTKWTGLALNLVILILLDLVLYYIGLYILKDKYKALVPVLFWSLSSAGLSNIVFIRMYMLLTLELAVFVAIHIMALKSKNAFSIKWYILIFINVIMGGLTHYYYYPFIFFFGAPICIILLSHKQFMNLIKYVASLLGGFAFNLTVFSGTINHVFSGYRGTEVLNNLGARGEAVFTKNYLPWMNNSVFGGLLFPLLIALIVLLPLSYFIKKRKNVELQEATDTTEAYRMIRKFDNRTVILFLLFVATYMFSFIAIQGSGLKTNRYLYPVYPYFALITIKLVCVILENVKVKKWIQYAVISVLVIILCVLSLIKNKVENQYPEYDSVVENVADLKGRDCIIYYKNYWLDIYSTMTMSFDMDETYFLKPDEMDSIESILDGRKTKDELVIWIQSEIDEEETKAIMNVITNRTDYNSYELKINYLTQVFELKK